MQGLKKLFSRTVVTSLLVISTNTTWACEGHLPEMFFSGHKALIHGGNSSSATFASKHFPAQPERYFERNHLARKALKQGKCDQAIDLLQASLAEYSDDGDVWRSLAICQSKTDELVAAVVSYKKALELGTTPWDSESDSSFNPNDIMMNIARLYSRMGKEQQSLSWLKKALDARYDERPELKDDPAFENLKNNPEFVRLLGIAQGGNLSRDEQWKRDIEFLREQVSILHFDPDHHSSTKTLNTQLEQLLVNIPQLNDKEITAELVNFTGALGAGHDMFWPVGGERGQLMPFALKFYMFTDGLYIIDAYDPALIGAKVESFNNTPVDNAYEKIAKAFPGDNEMEAKWQSARHFAQAYTLKNLGIIEDAENVRINVIDASGGKRSINPERRPFTSFTPALTTAKSPLQKELQEPLYLSRMEDKSWMTSLADIDALYVQIHTIRNTEEESFEAFSMRVGEAASRNDIKHLVLDLRHSPGGNGYLTPHLLRQLVRFSATPEKGELYILIGRNTFSASQNLITDLDWIVDPIFVGEPSGSKPNAFSESGHLSLPYSGLSLMVSSQFHQHSWPEDERIWIAPDVPVGLASTQFFNGEDPALKTIKRIIKSKTN